MNHNIREIVFAVAGIVAFIGVCIGASWVVGSWQEWRFQSRLSAWWQSVHPFTRSWSIVTRLRSFTTSILVLIFTRTLAVIASLTRTLGLYVILFSLGGGMIANAACARITAEHRQIGVGVGLVLFGAVMIWLRVRMMDRMGYKGGDHDDQDHGRGGG